MKRNELAVGVIQYELNKKIANDIVFELKNFSDWKEARVHGDSHNHNDEKIRKSKIINFEINYPELSKKLLFELDQMLMDYCITYYESQIEPFKSVEPLGALMYEPGNYYKYHCDSSSHSYRVISCLIYLNPSDYEGGETNFKYFNINVKPENPSVIFFPSTYIYVHAALPVKEGIKYAMTRWYNDLMPLTKIDLQGGHNNLLFLNDNNLVEIDNKKYFAIPERGNK